MVSGFQGFVDLLLNPVFGWLLHIPPVIGILILSLLLGLVSTLLQKYLTDQAKMRRLRDDTKKLQQQLKDAQKAKDQDKMMKVQKKMMPLQMDLMRESFRPVLITMIPFLIIFFWLNSHFAYYPLLPDQPFTVTATFQEGIAGNATLAAQGLAVAEPVQAIKDGKATWTLQGPAGEYALTLTYAGAEFTRRVLVTDEREYLAPVMKLNGPVASFNADNAKVKPVPGFWVPWGDKQAGWIFWYILFSIPTSLGLKKLLKVV